MSPLQLTLHYVRVLPTAVSRLRQIRARRSYLSKRVPAVEAAGRPLPAERLALDQEASRRVLIARVFDNRLSISRKSAWWSSRTRFATAS